MEFRLRQRELNSSYIQGTTVRQTLLNEYSSSSWHSTKESLIFDVNNTQWKETLTNCGSAKSRTPFVSNLD